DSMADLLAQEFGDIDGLMTATEERLAQVEGIGPERARHIHEYFQSQTGRQLIAEFRELGLKLTEEQRQRPADTADLTGKTFVVTGSLEEYESEEIEALIRSAGWQA